MNNCFAVVIREKGCQNNASMKLEKALTSITTNEIINLSFGYQLFISTVIGNNIHIVLANQSLGFTSNFIIENTSDILLDLPLDNGCYRVYIAVTERPCENTPVCPTAL